MNKQLNIARGARRINAGGADIAAVLANLNQSFAEFKAAQEQKITALQQEAAAKASGEDVSGIKVQIDTLQALIEDMATRMAAAQLGVPAPKTSPDIDAFAAFMRGGDIKADLKTDPDGSGGYLVPTEWDRTITSKLIEISPLRSIFRVQPTSKSSFEKLFNLRGTASGWVGETDKRTETGTATFAKLKFETGEIYANPSATQQILDDAEINLETWLASEVRTEFAVQETAAFIAGDGKGKPTGLLTYAEGGANAAKHPLGAIKVINSGDAAKITADAIVDLIHSLPAAYSQGASFLLNRNTLAVVRKLKDGQGNYLWQPSYQAGQPSTLLGYPVHEVAEMPDIAANALPIAFGDFSVGYLILDRIGVRVLRDPYSNKPFVQFYTTKRVGGGVDNPEAMRLLKIAA